MLEAALRRVGAGEAGLEGARVLDLYSGSGALGIEALSRGADHAVFVEQARPALTALGGNLRTLGLEGRATVLASSVERSLERAASSGPFDLVLVDPPYAQVADGTLGATLAALLERAVLEAPGLIVLEHASRDEAPSLPVVVAERSRRYGNTTVTVYARPLEDPDDVEPLDDRADA